MQPGTVYKVTPQQEALIRYVRSLGFRVYPFFKPTAIALRVAEAFVTR